MIKYFCDVCKAEITSQENGIFKIAEKAPFWDKHQKGEQMRIREYMLCIECSRTLLKDKQIMEKLGGK